MSRHAAAATVRAVAPAGLAVLAFLALVLPAAARPGWALAGVVVAAGSLAASWAAHRRPRLGTDLPARVLLATGVLGYVAGTPGTGGAPVAAAAVLLLGPLLAEPLLRRLARPWYAAAHLPVRPAAPARLVDSGTAWGVGSLAVLLVGVVAVAGFPGWLLPLAAAPAGLLAGWLLVDGVRRWRTGHRAELAALTGAVREHRPRFALYFSAPPGSEYQVRMWLPYLAQLAEPYLVVLPGERHNLAPLAAATAAPVVDCDTFEALDAVVVPSLRASFYVNNGMKNAHWVRYSQLTHVQLYHGDSDKAVTASPLNQLFDRVFVAGQAAIDRFAAHGVQIPADRFRIVGRPQVAQLAVADRPIGEIDRPTVLYAPTWVGAHADSNYCSLPIAESIVAGLLARGATVILRPHPYTHRHRASAQQLRRAEQQLAADRAATGREHRWGRAATADLSLFGCMDRSDAMICDVSSVASEYLYTGKPFAITDMAGAGEEFVTGFPVARAAYVLAGDAGNLPALLDQLLGSDPLCGARRELATYYLGDIPPQRYLAAFLAEARAALSDQPDQLRSTV